MRRTNGLFANGDAGEELPIHASTGGSGRPVIDAEAYREERAKQNAPRHRFDQRSDGRGDQF